MGPIFSWIKFCSSRTNRQSTKVLPVFLKNRLPCLPYLLSSWGIPVFKHKGSGSSNACLQKRKKAPRLQVSQGFLLTGPKAELCKLIQPRSSTRKARKPPLDQCNSERTRLSHARVPQELQGLLYVPVAGTEATHESGSNRGNCHRRTLIGHYRNLYDVSPWKYAPVVCKIKRVGTSECRRHTVGLTSFFFLK